MLKHSILCMNDNLFDFRTINVSFHCSFEGDKTRGMYEGEGYALFTGGHTYKVRLIISKRLR